MNAVETPTPITLLYLGDVEAWVKSHSGIQRVVATIALAILCLVDSAYQCLCLVFTVLRLPVEVARRLVGSGQVQEGVRQAYASARRHLGYTFLFINAAVQSPLICTQLQPCPQIFMSLSVEQVSLEQEIEILKNMGTVKEKRNYFSELIQRQNILENVKSDGNCGLRAIARSFNPQLTVEEEDEEIVVLRQMLVDYLIEHREEYKFFLEGYDIDSEELLDSGFDEYVEKMAQDHTWIGNLECRALSQVLNVRIEVFSCDAPRLNTEGQIIASEDQIFISSETECPVARIYFDPIEEHYQVLRRIGA